MTSQLRTVEFEGLPVEIRVKIYHLLLISYDDSGTKLQILDPTYERKAIHLHPAILRTNKQIHDEAAPVLYCSNIFSWPVYSFQTIKMFHSEDSSKPSIARRYVRMITKVKLDVNVRGRGERTFYAMANAVHTVETNVDHVAKKLSLCEDLKLLQIGFYDGYKGRIGSISSLVRECLEPLECVRAKKVRFPFHKRCIRTQKRQAAEMFLQVVFTTCQISPTYMEILRSNIQGPRDRRSRECRERFEEEEESELETMGYSDQDDERGSYEAGSEVDDRNTQEGSESEGGSLSGDLIDETEDESEL